MAGREIKFRAKKSESGCHTNAGNGSSQSWEGWGYCLGSVNQMVMLEPRGQMDSWHRGQDLGAGLLWFLILCLTEPETWV